MKEKMNHAAHAIGNIDGNTVRKPERRFTPAAPARIKALPSKQSNIHRRNRDRVKQMDFGYVFFLTLALLASALTLTAYIGLQSDITNTVNNVARLEKELNNLRLANEENYSRIVNNVDLERIRRIAITELGMTYAVEGQIIEFADNRSDYVRQLNSLQ